MSDPITSTRLYTEAEAADALGIPARSLRTEREHGKIAFRRIARRIMYLGRTLIEYRERDEWPDRESQPALAASPAPTRGTSSTTTASATAAITRGRETIERLKKSLRKRRDPKEA